MRLSEQPIEDTLALSHGNALELIFAVVIGLVRQLRQFRGTHRLRSNGEM
jgi:hypothetical protein